MSNQAIINRTELEEIKKALALGFISYDEAKIEAAPIIKRINAQAQEIAKKYGRKHYNYTFEELMR